MAGTWIGVGEYPSFVISIRALRICERDKASEIQFLMPGMCLALHFILFLSNINTIFLSNNMTFLFLVDCLLIAKVKGRLSVWKTIEVLVNCLAKIFKIKKIGYSSRVWMS